MGGQDPTIHEPELQKVVAQVPILAGAADLSVAVLPGGLSNDNYLVTADGEAFAVRIAAAAGMVLGIDRRTEITILQQAAAAGIAPELVACILPEGHLVSRFLRGARTPTIDEFAEEAMVRRVTARLRDIHGLAPVGRAFNPHDDIRRWLSIVADAGVTRPARLAMLVERVDAIERRRGMPAHSTLCHNDPYHRNFLDDGGLRVIDWEFAGMGDPLYDLAAAGYALDAAGRDLLVESYYGRLDHTLRLDLDRLIVVYLCWSTMWSLVQSHASSLDVDYAALADHYLDLAS